MCGDASYYQAPKTFFPILRVLLRAKSNGMYVTATDPLTPLSANCAESNLAYANAFELIPIAGGYSMKTEVSLNYISASSRDSGALYPNRPTPSTWETFTIQWIGGTGPTAAGTEATIISLSCNEYVSVQANGQLWPNAKTAGTTETFYIVDANDFSRNSTLIQQKGKILYA